MSSQFRCAPFTTTTSTRKEREWWQERNIDPLKIANALWQQSRERNPSPRRADPISDNASDEQEATRANQALAAIDVNSRVVHDFSEDAAWRE